LKAYEVARAVIASIVIPREGVESDLVMALAESLWEFESE
jgi:hypothetical protein